MTATAELDADTPLPEIIVLAPLSVEARAVRSGAPWADVHRIGMGPRRAARSAQLASDAGGRPVLIAGFCGGLDPELEPGDVVLASELRGPTGTTTCDDPSILAGVLRRGGLRVRVGPIASSQRLVLGERRRTLQRTGAVAVDMESAWLAGGAAQARPLVTLRVVLDTERHELHRPLRTVAGAAIAYRNLRRACALVQEWAQAIAPREILLASPRASCAGVDRAVEIVERALESRGAPVYVRKQIVHNAHVVEELEARGAVFVDEVDEVPPARRVIFSAHGVSPAVRARAAERSLDVIDATCPLVSKVHAEARRFAAAGDDIVLVGPRGSRGDRGHPGPGAGADARHRRVRRGDRGAGPRPRAGGVPDPDDPRGRRDERIVVEALRQRFPGLVGPPSDDICYATQNRQDAVRALAAECDLVLVVGSRNSSNSRRLVEVAQRAGCPALLVEDATEIPPALARGRCAVGVTAGASAPEKLVEGVIRALAGLGGATVSERNVATENVHFKLPPRSGEELRTWRPLRQPRDRRLSDAAEAAPARQVPAARRARAAVPVQPGLRGLRQDPAPRATSCAGGCRWSRRSAAIEECGAPMVSIAGGEPLIHPEIDEIVAGSSRARSSSTCAPTACSWSASSTCSSPRRTSPGSVHVDGLRERHDESVCREGVFDKAVDAIRAAKERGFRVTTNTTFFTQDSPETCASVLDFLNDELEVDQMMISPALRVREGAGPGPLPRRRADARAVPRRRSATGRRQEAGGSTTRRCSWTSWRARSTSQCTPWGIPSYSLFGWQRPCYLMADGYTETYQELLETTDWESFGRGARPAL